MQCIKSHSIRWSFVCILLNGQKVQFLTIQFSISHQISNSSIWLRDRTLSGATTPGQSELESKGNEGVLDIPQSSRTQDSPSDCLLSYPGHSSAQMQLVYSSVPTTGLENILWHSYSRNLFQCIPMIKSFILYFLSKKHVVVIWTECAVELNLQLRYKYYFKKNPKLTLCHILPMIQGLSKYIYNLYR